jgi:uncharacterized protein YecE (DUF72 family)
VRVAFEFRHASWHEDGVVDLLRQRNVALCVADGEKLDPLRVATADFGYLRLRSAEYDDTELREWADWTAGQAWADTFVFFKHEDGATGPAFARRFLELTSG